MATRSDLSARSHKGRNALSFALGALCSTTFGGHQAALGFDRVLFLATGEMINDQDAEGQTALMRALARGQFFGARDLLPLTDLSLADQQGRTVFSLLLDLAKRAPPSLSYTPFPWTLLESVADRLDEAHVLQATANSLTLKSLSRECPRLFARAAALRQRAEIQAHVDLARPGASAEQADALRGIDTIDAPKTAATPAPASRPAASSACPPRRL